MIGTRHRLLDHEQAIRSDDAFESRIQGLLISDVHPGVLSPDRVKGIILKWKFERIARLMCYVIPQSHQLGKHLTSPHIRLSEIDHRDITAEFKRQCPRRSTQSAADIQDVQIRFQPGEIREPQCEAFTTAVKLIEGREIIQGQCSEIFS